MPAENELYDADLEQTWKNHAHLQSNGNLLYWYRKLYENQFCREPEIRTARILEIGSGSSPLNGILSNVTTSDILNLSYLDIIFDCHEIADLKVIADNGLDVITMTNVLHHLRDPMTFLRGATRKLAKGGRLYMTEPYFSVLSYPMYKLLHHEPTDFSIAAPRLAHVDGPLSTSNQAIPHMIFFQRADWLLSLSDVYDLEKTKIAYFTWLSYPMTGGINRRLPIPEWMYRRMFSLDDAVAKRWPKFFASFFTACLVAR